MVMPYIIKPPVYDNSELKIALAQFDNQSDGNSIKAPTKLFDFNPNTVSRSKLLMLGFNEKQAQTLINYRTKFKKFQSPKDVKQVYGVSDELYQNILPYIVIPERNNHLKKSVESIKEAVLFSFNPNTLSVDSLVLLGLSSKQAGVLDKYRSKGGKFFKKEDLKKIYSISTKQYERLEAYIDIPNSHQSIKKYNIEDKNKEPIRIELNSCSANDLQQISGIGDKLSKRIIKYRNRLGGFYSINQLTEVYGIEADLITKNKDFFVVNKNDISKININSIGFKELLKHPYTSYNQTKIILNFREVHGLFKSVDEIRANDLVNEEDYVKIAPYMLVK